jgi:nucleotide sugar dehydrogenase
VAVEPNLTSAKLSSLLKEGKINVAIIGLGRIGLPTAALLAEAGANVTGVDIRREIVDATNDGRCTLVDEPGLVEIVRETVRKGKLKAVVKPRDAVQSARFILICVGTPVDETKTPDYSWVLKASREVGNSLMPGSIVIVESTVGPGIVEEKIEPVLEEASGLKAGRDFGLVSCPERSDPGSIVRNMKTVPRVVGGTDRKSSELVSALYRSAFGVKVVLVSGPRTANAVKLTENLFRDVNIALANEFALLYEKVGVDAIEVIDACATKYNFMPHYPGAGVGGPCLPSNSYYLISEAIKAGNIPYIIRMAREINDRMPDHVVELAGEALNEAGKTINGSVVAVLGVAYKPNVRDIQLTPVEHVVSRLQEMGSEIRLYDPMFKGENVFGFRVERKLEDAVRNADCVVVCTAHDEFKGLNLKRLSRLVRTRAAFVDARNVVSPGQASRSGFAFRGVGRGHPHSGIGR